MRKPNLFLVGFPKAGTTSLATMLSRHPDVYMPERMEVHYFEVQYKNLPYQGPGDMREAPIKDEAGYLSLYRERPETYLLDATPAYIEHPGVAPDIKRFNPQAKILIMVRDPVERCFSNYCHQVRNGRERMSFEQALSLEEKRKNENWGMFWRYKENSYYYERAKVYYDNFEPERIKTILTHELNRNQQAVLQEILDWLDLPCREISISTRYNKSGRPNLKLRILSRVGSTPVIKGLIRGFIPKDALEELKNKNISEIELNHQTRLELRESFREDIMSLADLIKKDLSAWYT